MKLQSLHKVDDTLILLFENEQGVLMRPFGKDVYTTVSEGIFKSTILQYKADVLEENFNLDKLRKRWNLKQ